MKRKIRLGPIESISSSAFTRRTLKFTQIEPGSILPCYEGITQKVTSTANYQVDSRGGYMNRTLNHNYIVKEDGTITRINTTTSSSSTATHFSIAIPNAVIGESIQLYFDMVNTANRPELYNIQRDTIVNEAFYNTNPFPQAMSPNNQGRFLRGEFKYLSCGVKNSFKMAQSGSLIGITGKISDIPKNMTEFYMSSVQPLGLQGYDSTNFSDYALTQLEIRTTSNIMTYEQHAQLLTDLLDTSNITKYYVAGNQSFALMDGALRVRAKNALGNNFTVDGINAIVISGNSAPISNVTETYSLDLVQGYSLYMTEWSVNNGATITPLANKIDVTVTFPSVTEETTFTIRCIVDKTMTKTFTAVIAVSAEAKT